ncbi:MAG: minor capsid protein, partial [Oscillospiraceae bacterium]|nr:minor capsid protein [Oscillospiraceae bacterium]
MKYTDSEKWKFMKLDYSRQNTLINHPEYALPNADTAIADSRKFTEYLFSSNNAKGWSKGQAFTSRLGYDKNNYLELKNEILTKAGKYPSTYKGSSIYGNKY